MTTDIPPTAPPTEGTAETLRIALSTGTRPRRSTPLSSSVTFAWRALLKIKHVPEQLFDVTGFPIMFTLMFTYLFGGALGGSPREYVQNLLPGILVMTVAMTTMNTGMEINKDINKGIFDRFRSLPIWRPAALVGALLADALRYTQASAIVIALGLLIGFRPGGGVLGVVAAVALLLVFAFSLSWLWAALGFLMRTEQSLMTVSMMVLFPLTFISNVFVNPRTMPGWLESFVGINPITLLTATSRGLMHGTTEAGQAGWVLLTCAALIAIFGPTTMYLFRNKQ